MAKKESSKKAKISKPKQSGSMSSGKSLNRANLRKIARRPIEDFDEDQLIKFGWAYLRQASRKMASQLTNDDTVPYVTDSVEAAAFDASSTSLKIKNVSPKKEAIVNIEIDGVIFLCP